MGLLYPKPHGQERGFVTVASAEGSVAVARLGESFDAVPLTHGRSSFVGGSRHHVHRLISYSEPEMNEYECFEDAHRRAR